MQPARFISLLLILASALIIGTTGGLIAGMAELQTSATHLEQPEPSVSPTPASSKPTVASVPRPAAGYTAVGGNDTSEPDLSIADIAQVETMLEALGYNTNGGILPAVQKYQQDNSLNVTGYLDLNTIYSMVNQVRINRIKQLTS